MHEAQNLASPPVHPRFFSQLSENDGRGHTLLQVKELPQKGQLNIRYLLDVSWQRMKDADRGRTCCPTCHVSQLLPLKTTTSVFEGLRVSPKLKQKACMLSRRSCNPAAVQDSKTTSSAYTRADIHLPEPNCNPACGMLQSRWPCKPSKKMPNKVGLRGQPCRTPFCWTREGPAVSPTFMLRMSCEQPV